jgi:CRISPR-associated protein Csm4
MNHFRLTLELRGSLGTPLASDTLWGHIAWGIRYRAGNDTLEAWLDRHETGKPPLVVSDPIPSGFFPRPVLPRVSPSERVPKLDEVLAFKLREKRAWIPSEEWNSLAGNLNLVSLSSALAKSTPPESRQTTITHAGVNRLTGGTAGLEQGSLFDTTCTVYPRGTCFDVWGRSPESLETVREWFEWGLEGGYGRDAATGAGHLIVRRIEERALPSVETPNAVVLLGSVIPRPDDPSRGFFQTHVKSGRLGGNFAIGPTPDGEARRQKYPTLMLSTGTVLLTDNAPDSVGRVITRVHHWPGIRQYGIAPVLPVPR